MAKYDEREGNSCHIHISFRGHDGSAVFADPDAPHGMSTMFRSFIAGQLATLRELTLFYAPNINSYKRFVDGSFAPTAIAWGMDNRTCSLRVVGHGHGMRMECRAPGGDVNQYLAVAALIAGGLHGIEQRTRTARGRARATRTPVARSGFRPPWPRRRHCSRVRRSPARRSATRSSSTTSTTRGSNWPRSTPPSPTGKGCVALSGSRHSGVHARAGPDHLSAAGADRRVGRAGVVSARDLHRGRDAGRRDRHAAAAATGRRRHRRRGCSTAWTAWSSPAAATSTRPLRRRRTHPTTDEPARDRDAWEFALLRGALAAATAGAGHLPRRAGAQRGARRHAAPAPARRRRATPAISAGNAVFTTSSVRTVPGTRLAALIGESSDAQCYHHQAIAELGDGLIVSATRQRRRCHRSRRACPATTSCVAVQWHPEERLDDLRLFAGVVEAARVTMRREGSVA